MAPIAPEAGRFNRSFERWARRVRARLALRRALTGAALGLVAGGAATALLWWLRLGTLRPWAAVFGLVGALAGLLLSLRRRWSDPDVALYLDARLGTDEAISTAVGGPDPAHPAREIVTRRATEALASGDPRRARPRVLERWQGLAPLGGAAVVWLSLVPLPKLPPPAPKPPGTEMVKNADLKGLDRIIALDKLDARDAKQRARLDHIAREAKKLRADLQKGMQKREAQARLAKLRDDIAAERQHFNDKKNRDGLEAAIRELSKRAATKRAAKALGDGDLVAFDREMQKLANKTEKKDREEAKKALEEAEKEARKKGASGLAKSLEEQRKLFEKREAHAEALRELAKSLGGKLSKQAQEDLEEFGQTGSPEAQKRLAESMEKALEGLSDAERKRLAERLGKQMEKQGGAANPMTKKQLEEMARRMSNPEGQKALREQLKKLANEDPSGDARRQKGLDDADRGGAQAERGLGAMPVPMQGTPGSGKGMAGDNKTGGGKSGKGAGGPGSHHDKGQGDHKGHTGKVATKELRSKADPKLQPGVPMQGATMGRAPARPGETANQVGTGALGSAGKTEVGGVDRSQVPEEYREQVGRYFQP
jgi:hypothetical protein